MTPWPHPSTRPWFDLPSCTWHTWWPFALECPACYCGENSDTWKWSAEPRPAASAPQTNIPSTAPATYFSQTPWGDEEFPARETASHCRGTSAGRCTKVPAKRRRTVLVPVPGLAFSCPISSEKIWTRFERVPPRWDPINQQLSASSSNQYKRDCKKHPNPSFLFTLHPLVTLLSRGVPSL